MCLQRVSSASISLIDILGLLIQCVMLTSRNIWERWDEGMGREGGGMGREGGWGGGRREDGEGGQQE